MAPNKPTVAEAIGGGLSRAAGRYLDEETFLLAVRRPGPMSLAEYDPEHLHHARTSVRRLRAILRVARTFISTDSTLADSIGSPGDIPTELKWLGGALGTLRDNEVMAGHLVDLGSAVPATTMASVLDILAGEHCIAAEALGESLSGPRYSALHEAIAGLPGNLTWSGRASKPAHTVLPRMVGSEYRRLSRMVRAAGDSSDPAALHAIRIQAKRCRYAAELAIPCCGTPATRLAGAMGDLQDHLGLHHDLVVLAAWLRSGSGSHPGTAALAAAAESEADRLATSWQDVWVRCQAPNTVKWLR